MLSTDYLCKKQIGPRSGVIWVQSVYTRMEFLKEFFESFFFFFFFFEKVGFEIIYTVFNTGCTGHVAQLVTCLATDASLDCRSRGREFDPGTVPYFHGD